MVVNMHTVITEKTELLLSKISELQNSLEKLCEKRQEIGVLLIAYTPKNLVDSVLDDDYKKIEEKVKATKSKIEFLQLQLNALQEFSKTLDNPESLEAAEKELERIYPTGKDGKLLF